MDKETQRAKIFSFCKKYGSITAREAFNELLINSPRKRISEMRNSPIYDVKTVTEIKINQDGGVIRYSRYFITSKEVNHCG